MKRVAVCLTVLGVICVGGCGDDGDGGVGPSNHAPVIEAQADTSVAFGDTLVIWADARDADGDEITYHVMAHVSYEELQRGYVPDAGMNTTTGRFGFRTRDEDGPQRRFTFLVEDGRGGEDSTTFRVNIN